MEYKVKSPISDGKKTYKIGEKIELSKEEAERLKEYVEIKEEHEDEHEYSDEIEKDFFEADRKITNKNRK